MASRLLKLYKKSPIHPSFILLFLWFVFSSNIYNFFVFCVAVSVHEYGHYYVAKKLGYKLNKFVIAPYGVCLNFREKCFDSRDEMLIAISGPAANIILSLLIVSFWWISPNLYNFTKELVVQSVALALYNLLPCFPLDGGRVLIGYASQNNSRKKIEKISIYLNIFFSCVLFILFFASFFINFNPTFCLCGVFLILGVFDCKREEKYKPTFLYKKKTKNFSKPFYLYVNLDVKLGQLFKHIENNKFTIFILEMDNGKILTLDENKVKMLALSFDYSISLRELLDKIGH